MVWYPMVWYCDSEVIRRIYGGILRRCGKDVVLPSTTTTTSHLLHESRSYTLPFPSVSSQVF